MKKILFFISLLLLSTLVLGENLPPKSNQYLMLHSTKTLVPSSINKNGVEEADILFFYIPYRCILHKIYVSSPQLKMQTSRSQGYQPNCNLGSRDINIDFIIASKNSKKLDFSNPLIRILIPPRTFFPPYSQIVTLPNEPVFSADTLIAVKTPTYIEEYFKPDSICNNNKIPEFQIVLEVELL